MDRISNYGCFGEQPVVGHGSGNSKGRQVIFHTRIELGKIRITIGIGIGHPGFGTVRVDFSGNIQPIVIFIDISPGLPR